MNISRTVRFFGHTRSYLLFLCSIIMKQITKREQELKEKTHELGMKARKLHSRSLSENE